MALGGATSLLPIVLCAPATSTRVVRLRAAEAAVVAAGSDRTAAIAATMALGGAISLLRIVLRAQAASTRVVRLRAAGAARTLARLPQQDRPHLLHLHLLVPQLRFTEG